MSAPRTTVLKYVRLHEAEDWLRLGWCPSPALAGTYHGQFSMLMTWLCDCPIALPQRREAAASAMIAKIPLPLARHIAATFQPKTPLFEAAE